ncbi:hypothetical protein MUCCIDRAFT_112129 [Mucor lusitanicus CBS 277.49]|uniref:Uncharacterized protein n=1 Tax=Mucor lusitanicus CBS 277.49 TaxID=747725 RepID=A0A168J408_MUCCL|nr:hypothetical protein MUCCIDRAFT_112129 [Mucor lusitanicus CBS 277.49]
MSSSPLRTSLEQSLVKESPSRFQSRLSERYNAALESPPRELAPSSSFSFTAKSSPLKTTTQQQGSPQHKRFEGDKYTSFEVPNRDRGEWREVNVAKDVKKELGGGGGSVVKKESVVMKKEFSAGNKSEVDSRTSVLSAGRQESPSPKPSHEMKPVVKVSPAHHPPPHAAAQPFSSPSHTTAAKEQKPQGYRHTSSRSRDVPHYMQATSSFYEKITAKKEDRQADNLLRPRTKGGISKRVSTSKIPRYRSTTSINAVDDIRSEMAPDDVYVPMAARIKLFEKGLGNASNKPAPITPKYHRSSSVNSSSPTPSVNSSRQSGTPTASTYRRTPSQSSETASDGMPRYLRQTSSSSIKQRELPVSKSTTTATSTAPARKHREPFEFATSKRADTFHERLNQWKKLENTNSTHKDSNRGSTKRKHNASTTTHATSHKHPKQQ